MGDDLRKSQILIFFFHFFYYIKFFQVIFCSIDFKKQSEHSGLRPGTSSLVYYLLLIRYALYRKRSSCRVADLLSKAKFILLKVVFDKLIFFF